MIDSDAGIMQSVMVGTADPDIIACEMRIRAAQLGADVNALDELIGEPLLFTGPDGQLEPRHRISMHIVRESCGFGNTSPRNFASVVSGLMSRCPHFEFASLWR
jgi:hypothetical protein